MTERRRCKKHGCYLTEFGVVTAVCVLCKRESPWQGKTIRVPLVMADGTVKYAESDVSGFWDADPVGADYATCVEELAMPIADEAEHDEFAKRVAAEHGFPLSDWQPTTC